MQRLEIRTPEGIVLRPALAGAGARFAAGLLDLVVFLALYFSVALFFSLIARAGGGAPAEFLVGVWLAGVIPVYAAANALSHGLWRGKTLGKHVLGLRLLATEGHPPGWLALILRSVLLPIDALLPLPVPGTVGLSAMALTDRRQRLGDLVAGTVVIAEAELPPAAEPFPGERWSTLATKTLALTPGLAARLSAEDYSLLRDLLARQDLPTGEKRQLYVRAARHFAGRLELGAFEDARVFLRELYLYLREQRELR